MRSTPVSGIRILLLNSFLLASITFFFLDLFEYFNIELRSCLSNVCMLFLFVDFIAGRIEFYIMTTEQPVTKIWGMKIADFIAVNKRI